MNKSSNKKTRTAQSNGSQIFKTSATWLLVFAACFAIGWFPLAKVYYDRTVSKTHANDPANSSSINKHVASSVVTPLPPIKRGPLESDVIKIEESKDDPSVQKAESPDNEPRKKRTRHRSTQSDTPINLDDTTNEKSITSSDNNASNAKTNETKVDTNSDVNTDVKTSDTAPDPTEKPVKSKQRKPRADDSGKTSEPKDVQKGDSIDRL